MSVHLAAAAESDVGPHRTVNQDAAFAAPWGAGVADGVGGGPSGDLASAALIHRLTASSAPMDAERLRDLLRLANWDLGAHTRRDPSLAGMATTFTGLFACRGHAGLLLAHTGDSRGYLLRDGQLIRRTRDDSFVQALVDHGIVSEADAAHHPRRNIITASLRGEDADPIRVAEVDARPGDRWLLCSDGISDYVSDKRLAKLLQRAPSAVKAAARVVEKAIDADTHDNVTAVVCDVLAGDADADARPVFVGAAAARFTEGLDDLGL